jgi:hypothetical protein
MNFRAASPLAMKAVRIVLMVALFVLLATEHYMCYFHNGREGRPIDSSGTFGDFLFMVFVAPFAAGIAIALLAPVDGAVKKVAAGIGAFFFTPIFVQFLLPAGADIYTRGFEQAVEKDVGIPKLQAWAEQTLVTFHQGHLVTGGPASYWSPGNVTLSTNDLPPFLKTGLFAPTSIPNYGPEISISTNNDFAGDCITISWYDHGLLVGSASYTNNWRPNFGRQLKPGVYSYYVGK